MPSCAASPIASRCTASDVDGRAIAPTRIEKEKFVERIWAKDATLWKNDDAHKKIIDNALGWLDGRRRDARATRRSCWSSPRARARASTHVVVLGMGGSSLCSEVVRRAVRQTRRLSRAARARLHRPRGRAHAGGEDRRREDAVHRRVEVRHDHRAGDVPPLLLRSREEGERRQGRRELHRRHRSRTRSSARTRKRDQFRQIFINSADIGGRYSALSYFGIVPVAVTGVDVASCSPRACRGGRLLEQGRREKTRRDARRCHRRARLQGPRQADAHHARAARHARPLDRAAHRREHRQGRQGDRADRRRAAAGDPKDYGNDRLFVYIGVTGTATARPQAQLRALEQAGHPVAARCLKSRSISAKSSSSGSSPRRSPAHCSGSMPSTSRTCRKSKDNTKRLLKDSCRPAAGGTGLPLRVWTRGALLHRPLIRRGRRGSRRSRSRGVRSGLQRGDDGVAQFLQMLGLRSAGGEKWSAGGRGKRLVA